MQHLSPLQFYLPDAKKEPLPGPAALQLALTAPCPGTDAQPPRGGAGWRLSPIALLSVTQTLAVEDLVLRSLLTAFFFSPLFVLVD